MDRELNPLYWKLIHKFEEVTGVPVLLNTSFNENEPIVQTPAQITLLYEYDHTVRNVFMNSPHPRGPIQFWMGDSRGTWDGDTLVVDVVHFNDQTWFDRAGNHHSEALHVIERYTLIDRDHINYEATIEDPRTFTRQWKMSMPLYRRVDRSMQLLDYECVAFNEAARAAEAR